MPFCKTILYITFWLKLLENKIVMPKVGYKVLQHKKYFSCDINACILIWHYYDQVQYSFFKITNLDVVLQSKNETL
jgi:hypothetical protein